MRRIFFNILWLLALAGCGTPPTLTPTPYISPTPRADWQTYTSPNMPVTVQYPPSLHYHEGDEFRSHSSNSDFFILRYGYLVGVWISGACAGEAYQIDPWYGRNPYLERRQVSGYEACLILPSDDQDVGMRTQSMVMVRLPTPIEIKGTPTNYLTLVASKNLVREMAATLIIKVK